MNRTSGYTLMELIIVVALLAIVVVSGTSLFLSNIRSGGISEIVLTLTKSGRSLVDLIETKIRFSDIVQVADYDRDACLSAGETGVSGQNTRYVDIDGEQEYLGFVDGMIASASADGSDVVYLNPADVKVKEFTIQWFCVSGINDKMIIDMTLTGTGTGVGIDLEEKISRETILLNSGKR
jgi:prepilin-type N-terminal cleavage/methylation domain-containing protein